MITSIKNKKPEFVILGYAVCINQVFIDLRDDDCFKSLKDIAGWGKRDVNFAKISINSALEENINSWGKSEQDYDKVLASDEWKLHAMLAINGKYPEITSKNKDSTVRCMTVEQLIKDNGDEKVRDEQWLDAMVNDEDSEVRALVAQYGKPEHLDVLVNDRFDDVRWVVAQRGLNRHLDTLVNDTSERVRRVVATLGTEEHRNALLNDNSNYVRYIVAVQGTDEQRDKLSVNANELVKRGFAVANYHVAELACDESYIVRLGVAQHSSRDLVKTTDLVFDKNFAVRFALAERGLFLDHLAKDSDARIRREVVKHGGDVLFSMADDSSAEVRAAVASQGCSLEKLAHDRSSMVRQAALDFCTSGIDGMAGYLI